MSATTTAVAEVPRIHQSNSPYQMDWKWHFFAGLYVLAFLALLSVTGALYLFDSSIEDMIDKARLNVISQDQRQPFSV